MLLPVSHSRKGICWVIKMPYMKKVVWRAVCPLSEGLGPHEALGETRLEGILLVTLQVLLLYHVIQTLCLWGLVRSHEETLWQRGCGWWNNERERERIMCVSAGERNRGRRKQDVEHENEMGLARVVTRHWKNSPFHTKGAKKLNSVWRITTIA